MVWDMNQSLYFWPMTIQLSWHFPVPIDLPWHPCPKSIDHECEGLLLSIFHLLSFLLHQDFWSQGHRGWQNSLIFTHVLILHYIQTFRITRLALSTPNIIFHCRREKKYFFLPLHRFTTDTPKTKERLIRKKHKSSFGKCCMWHRKLQEMKTKRPRLSISMDSWAEA